MVRLIHKTKIASAVTLAVAAPALILAGTSAPAQAECTNCTQNVDFNVNVAEVITVSITDPASWASGDLTIHNETTNKYESALLRNKVTVSAATNNATGVTVSMYTKNTNLVNQTNNEYTIPTLGGETLASAISANQWGYSTATIGETDEGNNDAKYNKLTTSESPITVFSTVGTASTSNGSEDIYFGAKADEDKQSGTYAQTVYFAAVTGTVDSETNPQVPVTPSEPTTPSTPVYASTQGVGTAGQTTYTYPTAPSQDGTTKTNTTEVSSGDTTSSYAKAAGVTTSSSSINGGATVATALAVAAAVAAVSGSVFFIVAKRRNDDDEEEE